jgi:hypothetical protein
LPSKRKQNNEASHSLLKNAELERPLSGHELIRLQYMGRIPPGEYRCENEYIDGSIKIETFRVDEDGHIKGLTSWVEKPAAAQPKDEK